MGRLLLTEEAKSGTTSTKNVSERKIVNRNGQAGLSSMGEFTGGKRADENLQDTDLFDEFREDGNFESTAEQKVTGSIPMLKNNKNALIRNTKPFSQRLKSGELKIDIRDPHAVAN